MRIYLIFVAFTIGAYGRIGGSAPGDARLFSVSGGLGFQPRRPRPTTLRIILTSLSYFERAMSQPLERLETEALELPVRERAALAHRLIASLDEGPDDDPTEVELAWEEEISRRLAAWRSGEGPGHLLR